jgi:hypothetical protein
MVAVPWRLPKATCTAMLVSSDRPAVDTVLRAKRILPVREPLTVTMHSSAFENFIRRSVSCLVCSGVRIVIWSP